MENQFYTPDELVKKLCELSGLNQRELAEVIGIAPQTLSNWSVGRTKNFDPKLITTVAEAMRSNPRWGIRMGTINRSKVEIVENKSANAKNDSDLANDVIRYQINYIQKLETEITALKEKLEEYKTK